MRLAISGKGITGTIYSFLFSRAGYEVLHLGRPSSNGVDYLSYDIDLLDVVTRKIYDQEYSFRILPVQERYFDIVIVSVPHYKLRKALEDLRGRASVIVVFGNVWDTLDQVKSYANGKINVIFGMPRAGGTLSSSKLRGAVLCDIILQYVKENSDFETVRRLFETIDRKIVK